MQHTGYMSSSSNTSCLGGPGPQLYGLPKVHKEGIPFRPIISAIGWPTYSLAKELARILSPLVGRTSSFIKNSTHFVQKIRNTPLDKSDRLVSFDVVSLFTKVPVNEAMVVIEEMLEKDESIDERTTMSPGEVCRLTSLCLRSTYFFVSRMTSSNSVTGKPWVLPSRL